jgi:hypothetical protein
MASLRRCHTDLSTSSRGFHHSDDSQDSQSTAPTSIYSEIPSLHRSATDRPSYYSKPSYDSCPSTNYHPRSSAETYASTTASQEELCEEPERYDPEYEVPEYSRTEGPEVSLRPSSPSDFAEFFPSTKRMYIRHDDTTYDGNMNLRVDAEDAYSRKGNVQLFHLRMHDLKKMDFSLRRYERSSGREVCHSKRVFASAGEERRPNLTRSVSNAFSSIRGGKPEIKRANSGLSTSSKYSRRQDSGYGSTNEDDDDDVGSFMSRSKSMSKSDAETQVPSSTTKLEFSNYAQVHVKRRGNKSSKRYEFEYWGSTYAWRRVTEKDGEGDAISYHLFSNDSRTALAHIVPEMRSPSQIRAERAAGGWVPPCSMWISDQRVLEAHSDVAE